MWGDLDELVQVMKDDSGISRLAIGSAVSLTVGYVLWTVRAGYFITTLIAQVPAWRVVDPLPILTSLDGEDDADGESLQSIIQAEWQAQDE
jgi:hypothetical protein